MKLLIKGISVLLVMVLMVSTFATPVVAGRGRGTGEGRQTESVDAEVRMLNGQMVIVVEAREGYVTIPVLLSESVRVDGRSIPLALQGNGVVVPTEDGPIVVPIEEFEVIVAGGQVFLVAEVNPLFTFGLALLAAKYGAKHLGGQAAAAGVGALAGHKLDAWIIDSIRNSPAPTPMPHNTPTPTSNQP